MESLIYAIGDIHGCLGLLRELQRRILDDAAQREAKHAILVYLGDYISRGEDSRGVVDCVRNWLPAGFQRVTLKGNHEDLLLRFVDGELAAGRDWFDHGGLAVLESYGIVIADAAARDDAAMESLRRRFLQALPESDLAFFRSLEIAFHSGAYYFVHGGVRPGLDLSAQSERDRLWIRQAFLESPLDHGALVVHGHSISETPDLRPNRVGIDTGAYRSGVLTCLVVADGTLAWLQTERRA